jgi:hypothetical protein
MAAANNPANDDRYQKHGDYTTIPPQAKALHIRTGFSECLPALFCDIIFLHRFLSSTSKEETRWRCN